MSKIQRTRTLSEIAQEIRADWKNVNFAAKPYLDAMAQCSTIDGMYFQDSAKSVVLYFLSNASTWKGSEARRIKKELKSLAGVK